MNVTIIGNGVTGTTVARHVRKQSDHDIHVISSETEHFFSRTALMYIYMGHMKYSDTKPYEDWFWQKNRINLHFKHVSRIDFNNKVLHFSDGSTHQYDKLVLATGSSPNMFGWPGQDLNGVQGLYGMPDLQSMETYTKDIERAVVVGGGLIGIEMAEMLLSRNIPVTFLVREKSYWNNVLPREEAEMVSRHIKEHHVDLRLGTELEHIEGDENKRVQAVVTKGGERIECQFLGLTAGVHPNIDLVQDTELETDKGILVNEYLETNLPDVYSAGDCAQFREAFPGRKPVEQVWYTGKIQGEALARTICGKRTPYRPGVWFNSAKFMDIEYMVYGDVPNTPSDEKPSLYWEHPDGKKSIRIVYDKAGGHVLGFNLMGVRYRHALCDKWIRNKVHIEKVLPDLGAANFDPEFFPQHEHELVAQYNRQTGKQLTLQRKRGWKQVKDLLQSAFS